MYAPQYSGIITNYNCTAACRHCMFASSPDRPHEYITAETSAKLASLLKEAGTREVHIGGGEPFMNFPALCTLIEELNKNKISISYIETNGFWGKDENLIKERLLKLRSLGVGAVMVSLDPFHMEFVPLDNVLRLLKALYKMEFDYFIWKEEYYEELMYYSRSTPYSHEEIKEILGKDYVVKTAEEYGVGMNGRALSIAGEIYPNRPAEAFLTLRPCHSQPDIMHCHLDLYGNIVPSGCPGIAAEARDYLSCNVTEDKYPVYGRLINGGVEALYRYAVDKGFVPDPEGYPTRCTLCYAMRSYLVKHCPSPDLAPGCFYAETDKCLMTEI